MLWCWPSLEGASLRNHRGRCLESPAECSSFQKIGHPTNKEFAIGAVSMEDVVLNKSIQVPLSYIERESALIRASLAKNTGITIKNLNRKNWKIK